MLGILAARSRLRLYVLMIVYAIMDVLSIFLLTLLIGMEIYRLAHQQDAQQTYWTTLASQLNFTQKIDYWTELSAASFETRTSKLLNELIFMTYLNLPLNLPLILSLNLSHNLRVINDF